MKLARLQGGQGQTWAVDDGAGWSELGGPLPDLGAVIAALADGPVATGAALATPDASELLCPVVRPGKMVAAGANYAAHAAEAGLERPPAPLLFAKYPSSLNAPTGEIAWDSGLTQQLDYEGELAVVIGRPCRRVTEAEALDFVFGYAVANDVSARDLQRADGQLSRSKSMDSFCPLGPWITTADEVSDPQALRLQTWVGAELRQDASTADMLFSVVELISYLSRTMTLEPGDVVLTGTPAGTALAFDPPKFLDAGDVVRCEVEGLGRLDNAVVEVTGSTRKGASASSSSSTTAPTTATAGAH